MISIPWDGLPASLMALLPSSDAGRLVIVCRPLFTWLGLPAWLLTAWFQSSLAHHPVIMFHLLSTWLGLPAWLLTAWFQSSLAHHPVIVFHPLFTWLGLPAWLLTSRFQSSLAHHPVIVCHSLLSWKRCLCSSVMTWPHSPVVYIPSCDYVQSFVQLGRAICTTS